MNRLQLAAQPEGAAALEVVVGLLGGRWGRSRRGAETVGERQVHLPGRRGGDTQPTIVAEREIGGEGHGERAPRKHPRA